MLNQRRAHYNCPNADGWMAFQMTSFYKHHVFFCLNQRDPGERPSCANCGAQAMQEYAKQRIKALGLAGEGKVRINKAGCLDRCELGPALVVYPDATWYTYVDEADIDEIIDSHLVGGRIVERLLIGAPRGGLTG
jgi:(2Fe-2S) ferredoxin